MIKNKRFEDIEALQLACEFTRKVYYLTKKAGFTKVYRLKRQIQNASRSTMHNIAEGFDSESNTEFIRFLRYAKSLTVNFEPEYQNFRMTEQTRNLKSKTLQIWLQFLRNMCKSASGNPVKAETANFHFL